MDQTVHAGEVTLVLDAIWKSRDRRAGLQGSSVYLQQWVRRFLFLQKARSHWVFLYFLITYKVCKKRKYCFSLFHTFFPFSKVLNTEPKKHKKRCKSFEAQHCTFTCIGTVAQLFKELNNSGCGQEKREFNQIANLLARQRSVYFNCVFLTAIVKAYLRVCETRSQCVSFAPPRVLLEPSLAHFMVFHMLLISKQREARFSECES